MTIAGIGLYSAPLISSEIGDVNRFADSHRLCSCAWLTPSTHSSWGVTYHGRITKQGSRYLRWMVTERAKSQIRTQPDSALTAPYGGLARRRGGSKATVAAVSKLLGAIHWALKEKREYYS